MTGLEALASAVIQGKHKDAELLTRQAIEKGVPAEAILREGLISAMQVVGARFGKNEIFVPEVLLSARAMKAAMGVLEPILSACGIEPVGTIVLGTVKGDLHDIGKNLVAMMLKGNGFKVVDLGVNVPSEKFVEAVRVHAATLVGMSALLTTTMSYMENVIEKMKEAGIYGPVKTFIGGAPVTARFAEEIGAHGYGKDATAAVALAKELVGSGK